MLLLSLLLQSQQDLIRLGLWIDDDLREVNMSLVFSPFCDIISNNCFS